MKNRKGLRLPIAVLVMLHLPAIFAGFIAPYRFEAQDREHPYVPPTRIHFVDAGGSFHWRPFVYGWKSREGAAQEYDEDPASMFPLVFFRAGEEYTLLWVFHPGVHFVSVEAPGYFYLLGTDGLGRDQYSRLLYGSEVSMLAGLLAAALAVGMGTFLGGLAGLYGGWADQAVMRCAEIFLAVPWFYLLLAIRASRPLKSDPVADFLLVVAVLGTLWWARPARLIRGFVLSQRERNYVLAARGAGGSNLHLWRKHILPATLGVAATQFTVLVPQSIMVEGILSFLGLGISEPAPSWGNMLAVAQQYHILVSHSWMLLPVLVPIPLFFTYQVLADRLQTRLQLEQ